MADLSNLIYPIALSNPQQPGGDAEPPVQRSRLPRRAGAVARLTPLLTLLALSLIPLGMSVFGSQGLATHEPSPSLAYSNAPLRPALPADASRRWPGCCTHPTRRTVIVVVGKTEVDVAAGRSAVEVTQSRATSSAWPLFRLASAASSTHSAR
jgi:hypothetical protein